MRVKEILSDVRLVIADIEVIHEGALRSHPRCARCARPRTAARR
jgi:hypothetical protein